MSDFEDDMDVDAPAADTSITFGAADKKGKRSAANLPVEAEDSLPWFVNQFFIQAFAYCPRVEKYRPNSLDDVEGHRDIIATINKFVDSNVRSKAAIIKCFLIATATTASPSLWPPWHGQDVHSARSRATYIRKQKHQTDGTGAQCFR